VTDYDAWKAEFDQMPPSVGGASFHRINRLVDDPNVITVVAGFASADAARAFVENPDLASAMQRAGVMSEPRIEIHEEVEAVQY
jgi:hypothetical protein